MKYLRYYLLSHIVIQKMINECKGATQKFVSLGYLRDFQIPLPSLSEQQTIVSHLDELHQSISSLRSLYQQQLTEYDALWQSTLDKAFKGELTS